MSLFTRTRSELEDNTNYQNEIWVVICLKCKRNWRWFLKYHTNFVLKKLTPVDDGNVVLLDRVSERQVRLPDVTIGNFDGRVIETVK